MAMWICMLLVAVASVEGGWVWLDDAPKNVILQCRTQGAGGDVFLSSTGGHIRPTNQPKWQYSAIDMNRNQQRFQEATENCLHEIGITQEELDNNLTLESSTTNRNVKCFMHCFYTFVGFLGPDNRFNYDALQHPFNPQRQAQFKECVDYYYNYEDGCENAFNVMVCSHKSLMTTNY